MYSRKDNLLIRPWQQQKFEQHRSKVQSALPAIDTSPPAYRGHVVTKLKKKQIEHERCRKIERDNYLLLQKMNYIMKTKRVDNFWRSTQSTFLNRRNIYNIVVPDIEDTLYDYEETENMRNNRKSKCTCTSQKKDDVSKVIEERIRWEPTMKPTTRTRSKSVPIRKLKSFPIIKENTALSSSASFSNSYGSAKTNTKTYIKSPNTRKQIINLRKQESITFSSGSLKLTVNFPTDTTVEFQKENIVKLLVNNICYCKNSPTVVM